MDKIIQTIEDVINPYPKYIIDECSGVKVKSNDWVIFEIARVKIKDAF